MRCDWFVSSSIQQFSIDVLAEFTPKSMKIWRGHCRAMDRIELGNIGVRYDFWIPRWRGAFDRGGALLAFVGVIRRRRLP